MIGGAFANGDVKVAGAGIDSEDCRRGVATVMVGTASAGRAGNGCGAEKGIDGGDGAMTAGAAVALAPAEKRRGSELTGAARFVLAARVVAGNGEIAVASGATVSSTAASGAGGVSLGFFLKKLNIRLGLN